jgi:hypothetical protein
MSIIYLYIYIYSKKLGITVLELPTPVALDYLRALRHSLGI